MKVGSDNFVTRGILLLIFVINRILLESILSPTISSISLVILMIAFNNTGEIAQVFINYLS
jgi:hypothetical protein